MNLPVNIIKLNMKKCTNKIILLVIKKMKHFFRYHYLIPDFLDSIVHNIVTVWFSKNKFNNSVTIKFKINIPLNLTHLCNKILLYKNVAYIAGSLICTHGHIMFQRT